MFVIMIAGASSLFAEDQPSGVKPYGNLYLYLGYSRATTYDALGLKTDSNDTIYKVLDDSNIGFNFNYTKYSGIFELGLSDSDSNRTVKVLKAYGTYKSEIGEFMAGQAYDPYVRWSNEQANLARSKNFGALFESPTPQLLLKSKFGLYVDIIKPYVPTDTYYLNTSSTLSSSSSEYTVGTVQREVTTKLERSKIAAMVPKVAVGFDYTSQNIDFGIGCAGNVYKVKSTDDVTFNKLWIKSYVAYANINIKYSSFSFLVNGGAAVNPANLGISVQSQGSSIYYPGAACAIENIATGKTEIKDTWNIQVFAEAGWNFSPDIVLHAGSGFSVVDYPVPNTKKDYAVEYYANVRFNIGGMIWLTPSFSYHDNMKNMNGDKEGSELVAGILTTVSFY